MQVLLVEMEVTDREIPVEEQGELLPVLQERRFLVVVEELVEETMFLLAVTEQQEMNGH